MKKVIILFSLLFLLTACDSTETFTKKCVQKINTETIDNTKNITFIYNNKDEVLKVIVKDKYKGNSQNIKLIKESASTYNNTLVKNKEIKVQILKDEENQYILKYNFNVLKMSKEDLDSLNLKKDWLKLNRQIEKSTLECDK